MSSRDTFTVELHPADDTRDALLRSIHDATEDRYSMVGEMAAPDNELLLLARSNERGQLVTLALRPSTWRGTRIYVLTVAPVRRAPEIGEYVMPTPAEQTAVPIAPEPITPEPIAPEPVAYEPMASEPVEREFVEPEPAPIFTPTPLRLERSSPELPDETLEPIVAADADDEQMWEPVPESEPASPPDEMLEPPVPVLARDRIERGDTDEADDDWAKEMAGYSGWRGGTRMLIGAAAALVLFITLVALAIRSSGDTAKSTAAMLGDTATSAPADTVDTTASALPPVKASALTSVAELPPTRSLTETPAPPPTASPRRVSTPAVTASTPRARPRTATSSTPSPARRNTDRVTTASAGRIDPAGAFGAPPTRTTAAKRTDAPASRSCASLMADNARDAIPVCQRAALLGDAEAQSQMGIAHERGTGVRRNVGEAVAWFRKAASQGHAWSENHLGWMYASGNGVDRDDTQAVRWFRLAAEHGNAEGQYNLGFMYQRGRGVPKSTANAVEWYRRAAKQGNQSAIKALAALEG